jgi:hypothetical protein
MMSMSPWGVLGIAIAVVAFMSWKPKDAAVFGDKRGDLINLSVTNSHRQPSFAEAIRGKGLKGLTGVAPQRI